MIPHPYESPDAEGLLYSLYLEGVVITVEKDLPPYNYDRTGHKRPASEMVGAMLEAGFGIEKDGKTYAVEPLVVK